MMAEYNNLALGLERITTVFRLVFDLDGDEPKCTVFAGRRRTMLSFENDGWIQVWSNRTYV